MTEGDGKPFHSTPEQWAKLLERAREMRHEPTPAENVLWEKLRNHRLNNAKFRRQYTIGPFIVDFFCSAAKLVVEVDGDIHTTQVAYDAERDAYLVAQGMRVLRFANGDVFTHLDGVLERIGEMLEEPNP